MSIILIRTSHNECYQESIAQALAKGTQTDFLAALLPYCFIDLTCPLENDGM